MKSALAIVLAGYLALAVGYNLAQPYGMPPDEGAHVQYVRAVAEAGRLPRLNPQVPSSEDAAGYEAHQPPLYYLLAAPAWNLAGALGAGDLGKVRAARLVSTLVGAVGVLLIWLFARRLAGAGRPWLALAAAGFAAFLPMRLSIAAAVSNDSLAEAAATGCLVLLALGLPGGFGPRRAAALGLALVAAILAKASNLLLLPVAALGLVLGSQVPLEPLPDAAPVVPRRRGRRIKSAAAAAAAPVRRFDAPRFGTDLGLVLVIVAVGTGWWFWRNWALYGDPLGETAFMEKFKNAPSAVAIAQLRGYSNLGSYLVGFVLPLTFETFWGAFGHLSGPESFMGALPRHALEFPAWSAPLTRLVTLGSLPAGRYPPPSWVYPLLALWTWTVVIGLFRWYRAVREAFVGRASMGGLLFGAYTLLVLAAFLRFNLAFFQAQGRYLFPALGPLALVFAAGWLQWFAPRRERTGSLILAAAMAALALYAVLGVIVPNFGRG
jgi:hypothetical protein